MKRAVLNNIFLRGGTGAGTLVALCLVFAFAAAPLHAAIAPAGTLILGQSTASYEANGNSLVAVSNLVTTGVLPLYGPTVLPDGTVLAPAGTVSTFSGETVTFGYSLTNSGNAEDTYAIWTRVVAPSDFIPADVAVYLDEDGDGLVDPGETVIVNAGPLAPMERVRLVLSARLPYGLTGGESAHLDLMARSAADTSSVDRGNVLRIMARDEAEIIPVLSSDRSEVQPGGTVEYTIDFANSGERGAVDVIVTGFIDYLGMNSGTRLVPGSVSSSVAGTVEYLDAASLEWTETAVPADRVRGARLRLENLYPGESGSLSMTVGVDAGHEWGQIRNAAAADYTGGDGVRYARASNELSILVGRVSNMAIGPQGNPFAQEGTSEDRVIVSLDGADSVCTFWHEISNEGNYTDTVRVAVIDSAGMPAGWEAFFVDAAGTPITGGSDFSACAGSIPSGGSIVLGLCLTSQPERFRIFTGREFPIELEARSLVDTSSANEVQDVLVKGDIPLISIEQSVREPSAMVGDILSYIVTVRNLTSETSIDSVEVLESLSPGLGYAGGSDEPEKRGNALMWRIESLGPGERREIYFRAVVKAGQERGRLVSSAWAYGVSQYGERASDGPAVASTLIVDGVFSRKGLVFGSVFLDIDGDGLRSAKEGGAGGVSVFLENGTCAVTDSSGAYSIPGVAEGRHVVRIDPKTLPDALSSVKAGYFGMGIAGEYLIDLAPSGNRRVDFPLGVERDDMRGDASAALRGSATAAPRSDIDGGGTGESADGSSPEDLPAADSGRPADTLSVHTENGPAEAGKGPGGLQGAGAGSSAGTSGAGGSSPDNGTEEGWSGYRALTIPSTYFSAGSAILREIPIREIAALSLWMMENPGWSIAIEGHTDSIPISTMEFPSNLELSIARARSVFQLLRMNGIPEKIMDYTGYGARRPVSTNSTEEGRSLNRRVEIKVRPPEGYADGDPGLPALLAMPDTTTRAYSLADDAGVCSEIVKPAEGHIFTLRDKIDVEILSPLGSAVELYVNNVPVGREKIGQKQIDIGQGTIGYIFYDVRISTGRNDILVVCRNRGERSVCVRRVYLAGQPAGIVPEREEVSVVADGKAEPEIVFMVMDENGLPVRDGIFVTVTGPDDLLGPMDVNPHQNGVQAVTESGRVILRPGPSRDSRREKIHVSLDGIESGCRLSYYSPMRDWFLFGYGEGDIGTSNLKGPGSTRRSGEKHNDGLYGEGKISLYGQGEIADGHLMTLSVDTRPLREDVLLGRLEPEKQYPIYGDAGELRFNSASRSGTYVSLDHKSYSAMFGDFQTELGEREFTRYNRTFNGLRGEGRIGSAELGGFITRTDQVTYKEELQADGTSGFYFLSHYPLIEHSEKVRIEVRDRYRPEKVIRADDKQVNRDYDINYLDGSILFKEPVAAMDDGFNPVTIIVSYECRNDGEQNFIYGLRTSAGLADSLRIGATAIIEDEGIENSSIIGVDLAGRLFRGVSVETEYARSDKFLLGNGEAFRFRLAGLHGERLKWSAYFRDIDNNFYNPSFTGGKTELGSTKIGADISWKIDPRYALESRAFSHDFTERSEKKRYADLRGVYRAGWLSAKAGFAGASEDNTRDGDHSSVLMLGSIGFDRGKTRGELEIDKKISGEEVQEYPDRIQAMLARHLWKKIDGTLKHEYRSGSLTGARHLTQIGLESRVSEKLNVYSRYQMEGAMSGERGQAVMGISNRFSLGRDLTSTLNIERTSTVSGNGNDDFTSMASGWLYTPAQADYRLKGDYEIRIETLRVKHLIGLAGLRRLGGGWSGLVKGDLWYSNEEIEADRIKGSSTLGLAWRRREAGKVSVFSLVRTGYERNSPAHPAEVDKNLVLMAEANYMFDSRWEVEGKIAGRWVENAFKSYAAASSSFLYQGQLIRTIAGKWDVTLAARIVDQRETSTLRYGGGLQVGRIVGKNLWMGCGYDFGGNRDGDSPVNDFERSGFHFGMKIKFNEKILEYFHAGGE